MVDSSFIRPRIEKDFLGHPMGLFVLFLTEMWERFSYYGMRALLVLYMTDYLFIHPEVGDRVLGLAAVRGLLEGMFGPLESQSLASQLYGLYTGLVYLTPLFGGLLADRVLGQRKSVVLGAVLMSLGHFLMAFETLFVGALLLLILGNGCFKPNIATQVGSLYRAGDPRRDGAFTIFYMGVNLGALLSPLVCGTLGQTWGWHWGFGAAGIGMIIGLAVYVVGAWYFLPPEPSKAQRELNRAKPDVPLTNDDWKAIAALGVLCALNVVFWAVYEQQGNTMQLWADRRTNWTWFGFEVPSTWFQSLNPLLILALAPILDGFWRWQDRRSGQPSSVTKMAIGCLLLGASFLFMVAASRALPGETRGSILWLFSTTLVLTVGELYLSPIGLSLVTKVAPVKIVSMIMGAWYLSSFFGNWLSGVIGSYFPDPTSASAQASTFTYEQFFMLLAAMGVGAGLLMLAVNRPLRKVLDARTARVDLGKP